MVTSERRLETALWWRWLRWVTMGEVLGFTAPATVGAASLDWPAGRTYVAVLAAGAVEGSLLGWAQSHVLRDVEPRLRPGRFTALTAAGAVLAYAVGMLPSTISDTIARLPAGVLAVGGAAGALVLLGSIGSAQWLELRRWVDRSGRWVLATGAGWLLGLAAFLLVATPLWHEGQSVATRVLIGLLAAVVMAATVAAVTGVAMVRLVSRRSTGAPGHARGVAARTT